MRIIKTTSPRPTDVLGRLALYNGFDCLTLPEILDQLRPELDHNKLATYRFEIDLQAALLEMEFNGTHVDIPKRKELLLDYKKEKRRIDSHLHRLCTEIGYYSYYKKIAVRRYHLATGIPESDLPILWSEWLALDLHTRKAWKQINPEALTYFQKELKETDKPFNSNSSDKKMLLFYHFFGSPNNTAYFNPSSTIGRAFTITDPPWLKTKGIPVYKGRKPSGEYGPSTNRECMEKIEKRTFDANESDAAYWAQPFISACLYLADLNKTLQFLNCKLEHGIFRSTFKIGPETGRLASSKNHQGYGWNGQNVASKNRIIFTVPMGWKLVACDYEQIESRMVAALCYILFGSTAYLYATESGDLHSLACSLVWDNLPWPADFNLKWLAAHGPFPKDMIKAAKRIAGQEFYRGKSRRDVSKTLGHAANYLGKPKEISKRAHIPLDNTIHYYDVYFSAFPEIKQWHNWTIEQLMVEQQLTTPIFNRTRQFFGRPSDDATIREGVAYCPQSMAADLVDRALIALHNHHVAGTFPAEAMVQKHDELIYRFKEGNENLVLPIIKEEMERHYTITSPDGTDRDWYIPIETLVGWNLGFRQDWKAGKKLSEPINPDGLMEYPDNRTRQRNPFDIMEIRL